MTEYVTNRALKKLIKRLNDGERIDPEILVNYLSRLDEERCMLRSMDREAATYVESVICLRTDFAQEDESESGWQGLGSALTRALDERDRLRATIAAMEASRGVKRPAVKSRKEDRNEPFAVHLPI